MGNLQGTTKVTPLVYLYIALKEKNLDDEEILKNYIDKYFWDSLKYMIENNNLISISINGTATNGKSTLALKIKAVINKFIIECKKNKDIDEYNTICSDQIEGNRVFNSPITNICVLIDEWSAMGESGMNSSTENNVFRFNTDICAQRYIHPIFCKIRGNGIYDQVSEIILDVIGTNKEEKTTLARVSYHDSATNLKIPLGVINVFVGDILEKDWYLRYRKKKFARMDLLQKYGIPDVRTLELSENILEAYKELIPLAENKVDRFPSELISLITTNILQKKRLFYSMLGTTELDYRVKAILGITITINKEKNKLLIPKFNIQTEKIKEIIKLMEEKLKEILDREERNVKILKDYRNIQ